MKTNLRIIAKEEIHIKIKNPDQKAGVLISVIRTKRKIISAQQIFLSPLCRQLSIHKNKFRQISL